MEDGCYAICVVTVAAVHYAVVVHYVTAGLQAFFLLFVFDTFLFLPQRQMLMFFPRTRNAAVKNRLTLYTSSARKKIVHSCDTLFSNGSTTRHQDWKKKPVLWQGLLMHEGHLGGGGRR